MTTTAIHRLGPSMYGESPGRVGLDLEIGIAEVFSSFVEQTDAEPAGLAACASGAPFPVGG